MAVVISFFMPWISVDAPAVGKVAKILTGKDKATLDTISAYQVPILANSHESRFMISVIKIFMPDITDADKKSYFIWFVPIVAIVIFFLNDTLGKIKFFKLIFGLVGLSVFGFGMFKMVTTDLDKLVLKVTIAQGLWITLYGYLGIGVIGMVDFFKGKKK